VPAASSNRLAAGKVVCGVEAAHRNIEQSTKVSEEKNKLFEGHIKLW
jgi:hypothetical protein